MKIKKRGGKKCNVYKYLGGNSKEWWTKKENRWMGTMVKSHLLRTRLLLKMLENAIFQTGKEVYSNKTGIIVEASDILEDRVAIGMYAVRSAVDDLWQSLFAQIPNLHHKCSNDSGKWFMPDQCVIKFPKAKKNNKNHAK